MYDLTIKSSVLTNVAFKCVDERFAAIFFNRCKQSDKYMQQYL